MFMYLLIGSGCLSWFSLVLATPRAVCPGPWTVLFSLVAVETGIHNIIAKILHSDTY